MKRIKILTREERRRIMFWKNVFKTSAIIMLILVAVFLCYQMFMNEKSKNSEIPILTYHNVQANSNNIYEVSEERFRNDMLYLKSKGYTAILPEDFIAISKGEQHMPKKPVMITFDNGYYGNYQYAYPILRNTEMKATIGVIANQIGSVQTYTIEPTADAVEEVYSEEGDAPTAESVINNELPTVTQTMLGWEQCREMYESGIIAIGSKTFNLNNPNNNGVYMEGGINGIEQPFYEEDENYKTRIREDIQQSVEMIEQQVGNDVTYFTYPFGITEEDVDYILSDLGVQMATTQKMGIAKTNDDLLLLPRINITMNNSLENLLPKDEGVLDSAKIYISGDVNKVNSYVIDNNHYVKLRDFETILKGTSKEFAIVWDNNFEQIELVIPETATQEEVVIDDELREMLTAEPVEEIAMPENIYVASQILRIKVRNLNYELEIYSIDSSYYVRPIDLDVILGTDMVINRSGNRVQISV